VIAGTETTTSPEVIPQATALTAVRLDLTIMYCPGLHSTPVLSSVPFGMSRVSNSTHVAFVVEVALSDTAMLISVVSFPRLQTLTLITLALVLLQTYTAWGIPSSKSQLPTIPVII
jgi:hypothetical protein